MSGTDSWTVSRATSAAFTSTCPLARQMGRRYYYNPRGRSLSNTKYLWAAILAMNAIPFLIWNTASTPSAGQRLLAQREWLSRNFLLSYSSAEERPWTTVTCGFMHKDLLHLAFNMMTLRTGMSILTMAAAPSVPTLLALYLTGILGGSWACIANMQNSVHKAKERGDINARLRIGSNQYLGASAGVMSVVVAAACAAPTWPIRFFPIPIDVPLAVAAAGYVVIDTYFMRSPGTSRIAHEGHVGGAIAGALFWAFKLRRRR